MNQRSIGTRIKEVMTGKVVTVTEGTTLKELKDAFERWDFNAFPVVRGDRVVGMVTKLDLMKAFMLGKTVAPGRMASFYEQKVGELMRRAVVSVGPEDSVERAVEYMMEFKLRSLPVIENGRLVGMVSRTDILPHLLMAEG
jgi:CBS domain-containing protein